MFEFNSFFNSNFLSSMIFLFFVFIATFYLVFGINKEPTIKTLTLLSIITFFSLYLIIKGVEYMGYNYLIIYASGIIIFLFFFSLMVFPTIIKFFITFFGIGETSTVWITLSHVFNNSTVKLFTKSILLSVL
jgi:hypothetical protein